MSQLALIAPPAQKLHTVTVTFTVHGEPIPCGRPRGQLITPKHRKPFIHWHPDEESDKYEAHIRRVATLNRPHGWRIDWGAYSLSVRVYQREQRGDGDNFLKAVADGCGGKLRKGATEEQRALNPWAEPPALWVSDRRVRSWSIKIIDEQDNPRLEVLASMVGELDIEQDRKARARLLAARRRAS